LKFNTQTETDLDAIANACSEVEREWSLPFPTTDPRKVVSDTWAKGKESTADQRDELARSIHNHPRRALLERWSSLGIASLDPTITDRLAVTHALYEFAMVEGEDEDLTELLDGTLRAIGYEEGVNALGKVLPEHGPLIMSAAFALTAGSALLLYDDNGRPVVRTVTKTH